MVLPAADATTEPETPHVSRSDGESWFGHPRQLARLFSIEMWERFGFYGMRVLLQLYLIKHFMFPDEVGTATYGAYMSLVYLTPFVGGWIADRYLGSKKSVKLGAIIMAIGYFGLCFGGETAKPFATFDGQRHAVTIASDQAGSQQLTAAGETLTIRGNEDKSTSLVRADGSVARTFATGEFKPGADRSSTFVFIMLLSLSAVVVGNGFFKPNISTIVGSLYAEGDRRRDAGFTIFYMGVNTGSLLSQVFCPIVAAQFGWWAGFGLASIGMLLSWLLVTFDGGRLADYGNPPPGVANRTLFITVLAVAAIPAIMLLFSNVIASPPAKAGSGFLEHLAALSILAKVLFATFVVAVVVIPVWSWRVGTHIEAQMMMAAILLVVFNVVFWALFEQAGSSLTLFASRNTNLSVFGWFTLRPEQTQFFNAISVVLLAPFFSAMWIALAKRGREPSIPTKFALALIGVGAGFLILVWGSHFADARFQVSVWWLAALYIVQSMAELCISPVGLSMITKLAMARIVGMMMGVWFLSISVGESLAGMIAQSSSVETVGGQVTNLQTSLQTYVGVFWHIGIATCVVGVVLFALNPLLKRWMHGVD